MFVATVALGAVAFTLMAQDGSKFNGTWKGDNGQVRKLTYKEGVVYMEETQTDGRVILRQYPTQGQEITMTEGVWKDSKATGKMEGNKLVVETTNFSQGFRGANIETYKMTERFSRVDANTLRREITFEDPKTWSKPWTLVIEMGRAPSDRHMIFDSACHEGNYGMTGLLAGTRKEEQSGKK